MGKYFTVEIRHDCKVCGKPLPNSRYRSYCSRECRKLYTQKRSNRIRTESGAGREYQRQRSGKFRPGTLQCLVCGKWYVQVGSHIRQLHGMTAREYREVFELPISRGIIPAWYKELKGEIALENETYKNLEMGKDKRYAKNDPRAKIVTGQKGKFGSKGFPKTDYFD